MTGMVTVGSETPQSGDMIPLLQRHAIQVLRAARHELSDIARQVGVSERTVRRVVDESPIQDVDDEAHRRARRVGRPPRASAFEERVREWLREEPTLPTQELLRRATEAGYDGKKTAFYALVAGLRPPRSTPVVRFEGLPGEFSQHDFGHVDVRFVDGRSKRVHFFCSRLKYSRYSRVTLVENERTETIVRCLARDFVAFGGRPLLAVFDRPRTIVQKSGRGREVEQWNAMFAQAIIDIGVGVEVCAPRSGNQKGAVESLVRWVKSSFFKHRKFLDEQDLTAQLAAWHVEVNEKTPSRATGVIPETRRLEELVRLRPMKVFPETLALRVPVFVGPTAEVMFEGVPYSMAPEATHVAGTLFLYEDRVRIVAGRFEAEHRRRTKDEPKAPLPEHRAAKVAAVHGARAKLYEKRQQLLDLGEDALVLLTEITHREPRLSGRRVEELHALLDEHEAEAMRAAIRRAVARGRASVSGVREALEKKGGRGRRDEVPPAPRTQPRGEGAMGGATSSRRAARGGGR